MRPLCAFMHMKRWCPAFLGLLRKRAATMPNETCPLKATRPPKRDDGAVPQKSLGSNRASRFSCSSPDFPLRLRHRDGFEALPAPVPRKILPRDSKDFCTQPSKTAYCKQFVRTSGYIFSIQPRPPVPGVAMRTGVLGFAQESRISRSTQSLPRHVSQHS